MWVCSASRCLSPPVLMRTICCLYIGYREVGTCWYSCCIPGKLLVEISIATLFGITLVESPNQCCYCSRIAITTIIVFKTTRCNGQHINIHTGWTSYVIQYAYFMRYSANDYNYETVAPPLKGSYESTSKITLYIINLHAKTLQNLRTTGIDYI